jgi:hypothetical protein
MSQCTKAMKVRRERSYCRHVAAYAVPLPVQIDRLPELNRIAVSRSVLMPKRQLWNVRQLGLPLSLVPEETQIAYLTRSVNIGLRHQFGPWLKLG